MKYAHEEPHFGWFLVTRARVDVLCTPLLQVRHPFETIYIYILVKKYARARTRTHICLYVNVVFHEACSGKALSIRWGGLLCLYKPWVAR